MLVNLILVDETATRLLPLFASRREDPYIIISIISIIIIIMSSSSSSCFDHRRANPVEKSSN
jgi:hypothetical protein